MVRASPAALTADPGHLTAPVLCFDAARLHVKHLRWQPLHAQLGSSFDLAKTADFGLPRYDSDSDYKALSALRRPLGAL